MRTFFTRVITFSAVTLLMAGNATAQTPAEIQPERQFTAHFQPFQLPGSGCPVAMMASQRGINQQIETGKAVSARAAQGLAITLSKKAVLTHEEERLRVASAEIVVRALSGRTRNLLTSNTPEPDITRMFQLVANHGGGFSDLWVDGVTSILRVEVKSITYSDGSMWHESETQRCGIRPDPFVLVSSAR